MKKKNMVSLGIIAAMGVSVLAGCSQSNTVDDVNSAEELYEKMTEAANNLTSMTGEGKGKFDGEISVLGQKINMIMDIDMDMKESREGDDDTCYTSMEAEMNVTGLSALGSEDQNQKFSQETYVTGKKDGSQFTTYSREVGGEWTKSEISTNVKLIELFRSEMFKDAKFSKNGGKVSGKDTYKLETDVSGDMVSDLLKNLSSNISLDSLGIDFSSINASVVMYVYKDDKLPAKAEIDIKGMDSILKKALEESMGLGGVEVGVDVKEYHMDLEYKDYNSTDKIEIPKEALEAK